MLATVPGLACGMHALEQPLSSYLRGAAMYPAAWYPEGNVLLLVTPSIQITCYLASGLGGAGPHLLDAVLASQMATAGIGKTEM